MIMEKSRFCIGGVMSDQLLKQSMSTIPESIPASSAAEKSFGSGGSAGSGASRSGH